jgi:hypothetical protein
MVRFISLVSSGELVAKCIFLGGAFMGCLSDFQISFCRLIQQEFVKRSDGQEIGVAVLHYCESYDAPYIRSFGTDGNGRNAALFPNTFPTQLKQLITAVDHVLTSGVQPSNLHLIGDSAGANLILQLLSHTLHPLDSIAPSPLSGKTALGSACLVSPWTALTGDTGSYEANQDLDVVKLGTFRYWGRSYMEPIPESQRVYVQAGTVPSNWFKGVDRLVDRFLVTAGGSEMLRDDVVEFSEMLMKVHPDVQLDVEEGALHDEPIFDLGAGIKRLNPTTNLIIDWLVEGCKGSYFE